MVLGCLGLVVAVLTAGCSGDGDGGGDDQAAPSTTATTAPVPVVPSFTVTAREYGFDVPPLVEGGVIRMTVENDGKLTHEAVVVAAADVPLARLKQDLTPIAQGAEKPTPDYLRFYGGASLIRGGTTAESTFTLPTGQYVLVCTLRDGDTLADTSATTASSAPPDTGAQRFHFDLGMAVPFAVTTTNTAAMPFTQGTIVARDWAFELPPLSPGLKTLTFRNDGQQDHSLAVAEWTEGVVLDAAKTAFETLLSADADHPPPDDLPTPDDLAFAGPLSAGRQTTFTVEFKPNRSYVFACYMSDRTGGPLHAIGKRMVAYASTPPG